MNRQTMGLTILAVWLTAGGASGASTWYVATNGDGSAGTSWPKAFTNLQTALNVVTYGDSVYIAGQTFFLTNQLVWGASTNVTIQGGYAATNNADQPGPYNPTNWPTVLTCAAGCSNRILSVANVTTGTLSGVTLKGGFLTNASSVYGGGGLYITGSSGLVVSACVVANNAFVPARSTADGGGICSLSSVVTISNCLVRGNMVKSTDYSYGGGIYMSGGGSMTVYGSFISNNQCPGGATDAHGGGVETDNGTCWLNNCLVAGNAAEGIGDGLYSGGGNFILQNCTVAYNTGQGIKGTAIVTNSIVWGNGSDVVGAVTLYSSDSGNGGTNNGCLSANPLFQRGFYLAANSPCVDAGTNTATFWGLGGATTRTDGTTDSGTVDMGYHYPAGYNFTYGDFYVATNGSDANSGTNTAAPFLTVTKALSMAQDGTVVHVGSGSYTNGAESFPLTAANLSGLQLLGTNPTTTVINASGSNSRVLTVNGGINITISGMTLTGGYQTNASSIYGGGIYLYQCGGVVLSACVIANNAINVSGNNSYGGGIASVYSLVTASNCLVRANTAKSGDYSMGAGIYSGGNNTMMTIYNSIIAGNQCQSDQRGGGVYTDSGTCGLINCLVTGNGAAGLGDGLCAYGGNFIVQNSTVAYNAGQGIRVASGSASAMNSILWGNGADVAGTVTLICSDSGNGGTNNGCVSADPLFQRGFYLATNSPCVDAGTNTAAFWGLTGATTRADGTPDSGTVDMGYHYPAGYNFGYGDFYVATNGSDANSGTNAAAPFRTITKALSMAQDGTVVHVGSGSYTNGAESFPLTATALSGVQLLGTSPTTTIVNASGSKNRVLTLTGCDNMTISGMTLTGGYQTNASSIYGGGIYLYACGGILLSGCFITNNTVNVPYTTSAGGGIYPNSSLVIMSNCLVIGNTAQSTDYTYGGGIGMTARGSAMTVYNSIIASNQCAGYPSDRRGGGVYTSYGTCQLLNCLVQGNMAAGNADGLYSTSSGNLNLLNCTVVNNTGQGIVQAGSGTASVTNSILWGNGVDVAGTVSLCWSDSGNGVVNGVNGCVTNNPLFVNTNMSNYRLAIKSPCVNAGTNMSWMTGAMDLAGAPRIQNRLVDMGAYETTLAPSGSTILFR